MNKKSKVFYIVYMVCLGFLSMGCAIAMVSVAQQEKFLMPIVPSVLRKSLKRR